MTKTIKQVLERVYNKGFNDRCQQEKYADIDNQFVVALSVDQALKELEAIHQQEIVKARIDEMDVALTEVTHWSIDDSDSAIHGYGKHRIAELKAQQEE